jgi:formate hydrogenlyase subunit 4
MLLNLLLIILGTAALAVFGLLAGLVFQGVDRVLAARMQARVGPPLRQPFRDIAKLMTKENIIPQGAIPWLFHGAPVMALAGSFALLAYLPIAGFPPLLASQGDLIVVLYLLLIPGLAMIVGGVASNSPYATVGAQRELVTMLSYELPLATVAIAVAWKMSVAGLAAPFSLATIGANPIWELVGPMGLAGCGLLLFALLCVVPGELGRIPFDTPEAETELAGGLLVEYSGRNLALYMLSFAVKTIGVCGLVVALFFPYQLTSFLPLGNIPGAVGNFVFFLVKVFVVMFLSVSVIRLAMARFRINEVVTVYTKYIGAAALLGLILLMVDGSLN